MSCVSLALGVQASCVATKKPGGLDKRVYLGLVSDLASVTFGADNSFTAFTFKDGKGLVQYISKKDKNSATSALEVGENQNLRNHSVNLVVYWETAAQLKTLDDLLDTEGIFVIVETNYGTLEAFGLNKGSNFDNFGLKATANDGTSGVVLNDPTAFNLVLSGQHTNLQLLFNPAVALDTNIAALDALCLDPAPTP